MVILPINGICGKIGKDVVHPAHIPLKIETQPSCVRRARNQRPRGRFLGDHQSLRVIPEYGLVEPAEESYGLQVFVVAVNIRHPFPGTFVVIEIEHGSYGVHSQSVDMIFIEEKYRV